MTFFPHDRSRFEVPRLTWVLQAMHSRLQEMVSRIKAWGGEARDDHLRKRLAKANVNQLKGWAKEVGLRNYTNLNKGPLIETLMQLDGQDKYALNKLVGIGGRGLQYWAGWASIAGLLIALFTPVLAYYLSAGEASSQSRHETLPSIADAPIIGRDVDEASTPNKASVPDDVAESNSNSIEASPDLSQSPAVISNSLGTTRDNFTPAEIGESLFQAAKFADISFEAAVNEVEGTTATWKGTVYRPLHTLPTGQCFEILVGDVPVFCYLRTDKSGGPFRKHEIQAATLHEGDHVEVTGQLRIDNVQRDSETGQTEPLGRISPTISLRECDFLVVEQGHGISEANNQ